MNESIFLVHIVMISLLALGALRLGKEALVVSFCLQGVVANLFIFKQIAFLGLTITCTDAYIIGSYFSLGLLQHHYGKEAAHKAILLSFYVLLIFLAFSMLHLLYTPIPQDTYHPLYSQLLKITPRIYLTSLVVGFTAQKLHVYLQEVCESTRLLKILKLSLPVVCSQLYDTVAFSYLALYGIVDVLWDVMLMSYLVKLLTILCMTPFALFSKKFYAPSKVS